MLKQTVKSSTGFTLLEVLLSIALLAILSGISLPIVQQWQSLNDIDIAAVTIGQSLRRAQVLSQAMSGDSTWGVSVDNADNNKIILFRGSSLGSRDPAYDEMFELSPNISNSGLSEVVFAKMTGSPSASGTFSLSAANAGGISQVTVNPKGVVGY